MSLEIEGTFFKSLPMQSGEGRNGPWKKQDFVIEVPGDFPKKVCFSLWGDKTDLIKNLSQGDALKVSFDVASREFNEKWYTDLRAWKIETSGSPANQTQAPPPLSEDDIPPESEGEGDLPF